jgi:hypothetical protein
MSIESASYSTDVNGATVLFAAGAEVSSVKLPSDFSTIQILGLPGNAKAETITALLNTLGFPIIESCIHIKSLSALESVAEVKVEDPRFAHSVAHKFDTELGKEHKGELSIKILQGVGGSGTLVNRLQTSSVSCTWYKASRAAWLHYNSSKKANDASKFLMKNGKILGRKIQYSVQEPPEHLQPVWNGRRRSLIWSVQVANLDARTTEIDIKSMLKEWLIPRKIVLGLPSYSRSELQAAEVVENLLRKKGDLQSFETFSLPSSVKSKAIATFSDSAKAAEAVKALHNTQVRQLNNSKLFVNRVISLKCNILTPIYNALAHEIKELKHNLLQNGHVHLKSYPAVNPRKPITLRVSGENSKLVAEAKSALDRLFAGTIVMHGEVSLWDSFFSMRESLLYLNEISTIYGVYIHRDSRTSQLIIYGGQPQIQIAVQDLLIKKVKSLQEGSSTILLDDDLFKAALQGGWRRIRERFGKAANLNVTTNPKSIVIRGSSDDLAQAKSLLTVGNDGQIEKLQPNSNDCSICWDETAEPISSSCGHTYCKECFQNKSSSVSDGQLPMRCDGSGGDCQQVLTVQELKSNLSLLAFEKLLASSFETHIRTHPNDFQFCPTLNCPQVYRRFHPSAAETDETPSPILCHSCLSMICPSCNVLEHPDLTCSEFKDLSSEGTQSFKRWMKENEAQACPKCGTAIQKSYGCNHMQCFNCSIHFCWVCLHTSNSGADCYAHMQREHTSYYRE